MEVIIAIAIIIIALVASVVLLSSSISGITTNKSRLIAVSLAQEGLEIVRNIRDNNWFDGNTGPDDGSGTDWRSGDPYGLGEGNWRIQYYPGPEGRLLLPAADMALKIDSNGFYQYDIGTETPFYRNITIEYTGDINQIRVICEVSWRERGRSQSIQAETRLYNWYSATPP